MIGDSEMYDVLIPELQNDPLNRGYAAMTDEEVAASLLTVDRSPRLAPLWQIEAYLVGNMLWKPLIEATSAAAVSAVQFIQSPRVENLDVGRDDVQALLGQLVTEGLLTSAGKTTIEALAVATQSRAAELGISEVRAGNVASARQQIEEAA